MYEVTIIKSFSSAHLLSRIGGKCEELHGHNFKVEVTVGAMDLKETGLLIDFRVVKKWLGEILEQMDHKHLNELPFFPESIHQRKISPNIYTNQWNKRLEPQE
jgi:6-pyruvoyl-tetrahydropterin synthase